VVAVVVTAPPPLAVSVTVIPLTGVPPDVTVPVTVRLMATISMLLATAELNGS